MGRKYVFLVCILMLPTIMFGQKEIVKVDGRSDLTKAVENQYLFPEFIDGRVVYKDTKTAGGKMNYNMLLNQIQFKNGNEVLSLDNQVNVLSFLIGGKTLVKTPKGFSEVIAEKSSFALALNRSINKKTPAKEGAYGVRSESSSIDEQHFIGNEINMVTSKSVVEVQLNTTNTYYLKNKNSVQPANKKGFLKIFSKNKEDVEKYIIDNKTDFKNEEDLRSLFQHCVSL